MPLFDPARATYVSLVTYRKSGVEVKTPVWIAPFAGKHYVFSEAKAGKIKRLRNNSKVKIALCDVRGNLLKDEWLAGTAIIIPDGTPLNDIYRSFIKKYGWQMRIANFFSTLTGRIHKRAMIEISLE